MDAAVDHLVLDVVAELDAPGHRDATPEAEAGTDAPLDVQFRDVPVVDLCPDAGATLVYLLSADNSPAGASILRRRSRWTSIGLAIACGDGTSGPFSMAVDRRGIAYSVFNDGSLFRVDTASAPPACRRRSRPDSTASRPSEWASSRTSATPARRSSSTRPTRRRKGNSLGLATIDVGSYVLRFTGSFNPAIPGAELTGTSDGRLYAFFTNAAGSGSHIVELDKATAAITTDDPLQVGSPTDGYAFAVWGGVFWVFTSSASGTQVTEFDPATKTETAVTTFATEIVGAGVSTCAPQ